MKKYYSSSLTIAILLSLFSPFSSANITLERTRIVMAAPKMEASIVMSNAESESVMIQAWIEPINATTVPNMPFAITPSLSRLDGNGRQPLRIFYQGQGLPIDRESVFWLGVQEIPRKSANENTLQIAVRQRIKLFYRPDDLKGKADEAPAKLQWRLALVDGHPTLHIKNNSAFHVTFGAVNIKHGSSSQPISVDMLPPYSSQSLIISGASPSSSGAASVEFESINDSGGLVQYSSDISIQTYY
ncbi:molecular chaperone [Pseudomonas fluorescens]|nr:molecular chaperone [Pseudomonas fluorescens]